MPCRFVFPTVLVVFVLKYGCTKSCDFLIVLSPMCLTLSRVFDASNNFQSVGYICAPFESNLVFQKEFSSSSCVFGCQSTPYIFSCLIVLFDLFWLCIYTWCVHI
jgi:hypothetical protein